ncbi:MULTISPECIES: flagellar assembly protein FliW [Peribacillus]|uniref:flagellar assembly protein FliW n=1 Tax=Peribacillus TaxID=2675229 RepID=UPI0019129246|nr:MULTISPECIES: flagellar assembly protein FliW [unclassified Peribacillus]MBK5443970.1 flagellar assembly protein FliW [Peribacillus sp. TH24]MBK5485369.1 flagellar assembly protein FliW [Peribacillus sp. TH16]MBK5499449.1 flagellar assembly protein FliW [Peribacillus sp. TH14]WMX55458.1 flagellar assembly protein FliW [Peribacillus sp. R9-11]
MNRQTKFHGEIEIAQENIYTFESGIPGFLDEKQFCLLALEETPFVVLQSLTTKEVAFIILNPFDIFHDYEVKLSDEVLSTLQIEAEKEVITFVILTIHEPFKKTTANLQAPIILNSSKKTGKQFIMNGSGYMTKHLLIEPSVEQEEK